VRDRHSRATPSLPRDAVIPAKAGIQSSRIGLRAARATFNALDSRLRGNDGGREGAYKIRLNHTSDSAAEISARAAAAIANSAEISVSFFSTVSLELSASYTFFRSCAVPA
jgi:hypothetical protein